MKIKNYNQIAKLIENEFPKFRKTVRKNLGLILLAMLQSDNCSLPEIAMKMSIINNKAHNSNLIRLTRFLKSPEFKTEDKQWRMSINFTFNLFKERNFIENNCLIPINVDYTSSTDKFLILSASIPFFKRGVPLYFSMRKYPKSKKQISLKKMEEAFIKELKHLLPKTYHYVIVADRGFGNKRFADFCIDNGFEYILRIQKNYTYKFENQKGKLKDLEKDQDFPEIEITKEHWKTRLVFKKGDKDDWNIITSLIKLDYQEILDWYKRRFNIEKMFQDEKSSGFEIEKSKLSHYSRFKCLLYCLYLAQTILMFIGNFIDDNVDEIKKKLHLHFAIISAFSN
jgi:hypothetical protein